MSGEGIAFLILFIIALIGIVAVLIFLDREKRRRIIAQREADAAITEAERLREAAAQPSQEGTAQWYRQQTEEIRGRIERLRARRSPISSSADAITALAGRLDLANAQADYLDALTEEKEEIVRSREEAEIREAENEANGLKLRGISEKEVQKAEECIRELREAAWRRRMGQRAKPKEAETKKT